MILDQKHARFQKLCRQFAETEFTKELLDKLEEKPYTICFVDGNHENHKKLAEYPEELWNGGRIHRIKKNVI